MTYEEFKRNIVKGLRDFCEEGIRITVRTIAKNNGTTYEGIALWRPDVPSEAAPLIHLEQLYESYRKGEQSLEVCIGEVVAAKESVMRNQETLRSLQDIMEWNSIKYEVYPALLSTEANEGLLQEIVSEEWLDLSIIYIIRRKLNDGEYSSIKITKKLLAFYGISQAQLAEQAFQNLERDEYEFRDIITCVTDLFAEDKMEPPIREEMVSSLQGGRMYVLVNRSGIYGAAGLLNRKFLHEILGDLDFYILPSSIHETIFLRATKAYEQSELDRIVRKINIMQVKIEDRLAHHCYYYDGATGNIRIRE